MRLPSGLALAGLLVFPLACRKDSGDGLLSLRISADATNPPAAASKLVLSGTPGGISRTYDGPVHIAPGNPVLFQFPALPANDSPITFSVGTFAGDGCQVGQNAQPLVATMKAGAESGPFDVTLVSTRACLDAGVFDALAGPADVAISSSDGVGGVAGIDGQIDVGSGVSGAGGAGGSSVSSPSGGAGGSASGGSAGNRTGGGTGIGTGGIVGSGGAGTGGGVGSGGIGTGGIVGSGGAGTGGIVGSGGAGTGGGVGSGGAGTGGIVGSGGAGTGGIVGSGGAGTGGIVGSGGAGTGGAGGAVTGCGSGITSSLCSVGGAACSLTINSKNRTYYVQLPADYNPSKQYPVIFQFHPWGGTAESVMPLYGLNSKIPGAIYVSPQGLDAGGTGPGWANTGGEDIAFTRAMLADMQSKYCIDRARIFATGFSYGAMMSIAIGCEMSDVFRAIAPMAGSLYSAPSCAGTGAPIAMWGAHGKTDTTVPLQDGQNARNKILRQNHCGTSTAPTAPSPPCVKYQGCDAGYDVTWCEFDGKHTIPEFGSDAIAGFFKTFL